jgi:hypothetical protein
MIAGPGAGAAQMGGDGRSELQEPAAQGSRRTVQAPLGEHLLNIAVTQREPDVEPDRMADDIGWDAVTLTRRAGASAQPNINLTLQPASLCDNASMPMATRAYRLTAIRNGDLRKSCPIEEAGMKRASIPYGDDLHTTGSTPGVAPRTALLLSFDAPPGIRCRLMLL